VYAGEVDREDKHGNIVDGIRDSTPAPIYLGEVQYVDYETDEIPTYNVFYPFVHKRKSFEHEREIRAVFMVTPLMVPEGAAASPHYPISLLRNMEIGHLVAVPIDELLEAVYVAPTAPSWFYRVVEAVTNKYGFAHKPVRRSSLDEAPLF
jgi:hypothetical protein